MSIERIYNDICYILNDIMSMETQIMLRMRYNTNHSDMERRMEKESAERKSKVMFYQAKELYLKHKDKVDEYAASLKLDNANVMDRRHELNHYNSYMAMRKVIEQEMSDALESILNNPETTD